MIMEQNENLEGCFLAYHYVADGSYNVLFEVEDNRYKLFLICYKNNFDNYHSLCTGSISALLKKFNLEYHSESPFFLHLPIIRMYNLIHNTYNTHTQTYTYVQCHT